MKPGVELTMGCEWGCHEKERKRDQEERASERRGVGRNTLEIGMRGDEDDEGPFVPGNIAWSACLCSLLLLSFPD